MLTITNISNYLNRYLKEGSAMKLFVGIICAIFFIVGASVMLIWCVLRNFFKWVYAPEDREL